MARRHLLRPDFDRAVWLQQQMATRDLPITDDDVVRFAHNPEVCLTDLCLESCHVDHSITDLALGPNNQPAWLKVTGDHAVLMIGGHSEGMLEGDGTALPVLRGFLSDGRPVIIWPGHHKPCLHVGTEYIDLDAMQDLEVKIIDCRQILIWGWKKSEDRSWAYLWNGGREVKPLGSWKSRIVDVLGVDPDDLFVRFDQYQGLGPANANRPRGLHSLRRLVCPIKCPSEVLEIVGPPNKLRFLSHFRGTTLQTYRLTRKEATSLQFVDELRLPAMYAGGYQSVNGHLAYKVHLRHQQVAWVIGRDEVQPAMNRVTDPFHHTAFGWCYWGVVGQHLCLMRIAFPD